MSGQSGGNAGIQATTQTEWPETSLIPTVPPTARFLLLHELEGAHLGPLLALVPGITDADIVVDGRFQAEGTRDELRWDGNVQLRDGHFELTGPGQRVDGLGGTLAFHDNVAEIRGVEGRDTDGTARIDGDLTFQGLFPRDGEIRIDVSRFPVRREGVSLAAITGRADLATRFDYGPDSLLRPFMGESEERDTRRGALTTATLHSIVIELPRDGLGTLQSLAPHPDVLIVGEEAVAEERQDFPFVFHVDGRDPFTVRRSDFSARLVAELDVTYADPDLLIAGYINFLSGNFEIYGKQFEVTRGSLAFSGEEELDPAVDLLATYALSGGGTKINVAVTGRLSDIHVEFSSNDPSLSDRSRIIEALVSGSAQRAGQDATGTAPEAATVRFIGGVLGGIATGFARDALGGLVPVLAVESADQGRSARVRVGFRADDFIREHLPFLTPILRGAYVEGFTSTTTGVGSDQSGTAGSTRAGFLIELAFPEHLVGRVTYSQPSNVGLDLLWEP